MGVKAGSVGRKVSKNARMSVASELGSSRGAKEPMCKIPPQRKEGVDSRLIKDISKIKQKALGEGAVVCQACGSELREGAPVVVYAFRPIEEPTFEIGYTKCADGRYTPSECFTLGVRELLVEGRVGMCSDQAMQSSWPVLVAPEPVAVSAASTRSV